MRSINQPQQIAYLCFTENGAVQARRLMEAGFPGTLYGKTGRVTNPDIPFESATDIAQALFIQNICIVGFAATGILVRLIAPILDNKHLEPPVISVSDDGRVIVPVLGGHHGANALSQEIADAFTGQAAITTAGDRRLSFSFDDPPPGWNIATPDMVKPITAALLAGEPVTLQREAGDKTWPPSEYFSQEPAELRVVITERATAPDGRSLILHPPVLTLGMGAERLIPAEEGLDALRDVLQQAGLSSDAIAAIGSIDIKRDEPAVLAASDWLGLAPRFFSATSLEAQTPRLANPSDVVFSETGCHGVAEGAALALAGSKGRLVVEKQKKGRVTIAIAKAPIIASDVGAPNGSLAIVGTGAGDPVWRTSEAVAALRNADIVVGYQLYLDLVRDLISGKETVETPLGEERERAARALSLASEGKRVALLGSGDPGIYALATLVFEILEQAEDRAMRGVQVTVCPGISAFQAAAARLGAPMGHDFCLISLSDLLTPVGAIRKRLEAAAQGDFVAAFYNPQSQRRRTLLGDARQVFLEHRPGETPVAIGRNLGRDGEQVTITTLQDFDPECVDMLSLVIFGNSESRCFETARGSRFYTPRGYAGKESAEKDNKRTTE